MSKRYGMSDDWTAGVHRRLAAADEANRLALVLAPVQAAVRVVDPRRPPMRVLWASVQDGKSGPLSMSYTDFRGGEIRINPLPVLEGRLPPERQVDVSVFQALHEAGHSRDTRDLWYSTLLATDNGVERPAFEPLRVASWLLNVAEDIRSEANTQAEWPGFRGYFDLGLDWLWDEQARREDAALPEAEGHTLTERLRVAFLGARYRDRFAPSDPALAEECVWWQAWIDDYTEGRATPAETVKRGLDRVGEDPEAKREMAEMTAKDSREWRRNESLRQMLQRLANEGVAGVEACAVDSLGPSGLDAETAEAVRSLVREGLVEVESVITAKGARQPEMRHRKPVETPESRRAFIGKPDPLTEAMRAALVFRPERARADIKLQRRGEMDDEELWRWAAGDDRVFTEHAVEDRPDTALGMLVDISGSMFGDNLRTAQRLAQILLAAALDTEGLTPFVWAHTGDSELGAGADVFTIWEPGDPASRLGLIGSLDNGNNYDGAAIGYCADRLRQMEQPQKVLLVLSDGLPSGHDYGGSRARAHVRQVVRWGESQGVQTIQIAIDGGLRPADQAEMFPDWLPYTSDRQVPRDLVRILGRYAR